MVQQAAAVDRTLDPLSVIVIRLLKGVVYRRDDEAMWNTLGVI